MYLLMITRCLPCSSGMEVQMPEWMDGSLDIWLLGCLVSVLLVFNRQQQTRHVIVIIATISTFSVFVLLFFISFDLIQKPVLQKEMLKKTKQQTLKRGKSPTSKNMVVPQRTINRATKQTTKPLPPTNRQVKQPDITYIRHF